MGQLIKRHIGRILMDGGFLSSHDLDRALDEQKHDRELLGQVLVKMGVLKAGDINAPLVVQEHLHSMGDAARIAAGERQLLGALLVESGRISNEQLDHAIAEQKKSGEKLGEVFKRLGMLTEEQLTALLEFQQNQAHPSATPLRLGELLVATGHLSRRHLEDALNKQSLSHKKLGEVLVEEGYVRPRHVKYCMRMQKMLVKSVLAAMLSFGMSSTSIASNVSLKWDPVTDPRVTGYKVYYQADSSAEPFQGPTPIDARDQTTATVSDLDPAHSYYFAVTAYDDAGDESSYSNIVSIPEGLAPTTAISYPANNTTVSGTVSVNASASDNVGVTKVEFYVNGVLQASDTASPYVYSWNTSGLTPGAYSLMTKAYDAAGNIGQSATVSVTVAGSDTTAPTVAMTSPVNNATVSGTVAISASASDNVGVSTVEFYENGVLLYAANAPPYSFNWNTTSATNGSHTLVAKAYDSSGNIAQSSNVSVTVNNVIPDTIAPTVNAFTMPSTATALTVPISSLNASDNVGVAGYLITESATTPLASAAGWTASAPTSFTFSAAGSRTAYAWVKDAAGNVSTAKSSGVTITPPDVTAPTVSTFTMPSTATSLTVPISSLTASDNVGVTGYLVTESSSAPLPGDSGWTASAPTSFTFSAAGSKTAYAWAKDAAGNVSSAKGSNVTITLPDNAYTLSLQWDPVTDSRVAGYKVYYQADSSAEPFQGYAPVDVHNQTAATISGLDPAHAYFFAVTAYDASGDESSYSNIVNVSELVAPTVTTFTMPPTATSLTVPVSSLTASDNVAVTGYLVTENASEPLASDSGWKASAPTSFTFSGEGNKTVYAWAKDAAGNVSAAKSSSVTITLPDVTAPMVSTFAMPPASTSLTVPISSLTASDNVGVTGYLVTESAAAPSATAAGWTASAPTSFTFSSEGNRAAYAWVKDAVGNVSAAKSSSVTITLPDVTAPTVTDFAMPSISASLTVPISSLNASDNVAVTGYLVTESATTPLPSAAGWKTSKPTSFTFSAAGSKTVYAWVKDAAGNVSAAKSATVTIDLTAPTVTAFTMPVAANSLTVAISSFAASDNIGVTGYLVTESATVPLATAAGWTASAPTSFTFSAPGKKVAYAWVKDAAGKVSAAKSATVTIDLIAPTVTAFTMPVTAKSMTVAISTFTASDNIAVTGYLVTESAAVPLPGDSRWKISKPTSFTFSGSGSRTAYAWVKDAAGNVSAAKSSSVIIDLTAPTVTDFAMPSLSASLTVPINTFTVSDNVAVTGYLVTQSATAPLASATGWKTTAPASFTFSSGGSKTVYAWVKDAAGNVSAAKSCSVTIDLTAPTVTAFTMPTTASALTVPISSLTASDNVAVAGYLVTESATVPLANAAGWSASAPASFTFSAPGKKTAYAWVKDAVGKVSAAKSRIVTIDLTMPTITAFAMPATASSLTVAISSLTASDNVAVTGYLVTESATAPSPGDSGWKTSKPTSFIFSGSGSKTAYAWVKDAAGNVSAAKSSSVTITT